ncbi:transcription initiation factor TFIID [Paenibacillus pini]|uniref:Exonuclease SbcC n=1 Tax=Paenibacillus pini JCM 16418 TaxID=1236976 RepID=W7YFV3_9BACL|nr:transcription initiation factor TFIID [Paenibacillus pini]GAF09805.1 exonuclease SbcC [Paenibacillus pini JCM 16418]
MNEQLERFAASYAAAEEKLTGEGDDQSSIHYPAVFIFIGDKAADAIEPMMQINERKWENSAGVMYFHVGSDTGKSRGGYRSNTASVTDNSAPTYAAKDYPQSRVNQVILNMEPQSSQGDQKAAKSARKDLYRSFNQDGRHLAELNRSLRQLSHSIADYGRMYSSFDRIYISVITRVDDPLNVFIPEISLLAESILSQSFKSVQMDLYVLISEKEQADSYGYSSSAGVAFLRELDQMQSADYSFSAPLHVTEDGISIPVTHTASPLFDLVYVLSDKNERGISVTGGMQENYEAICHLTLLKNRKQKELHYDANVGSYNNTSFKNNMMTESGRQGYVSAGFSRVKRPNESIALTVLYHFYKQLVMRMKSGGEEWDLKEKLLFFGMDPSSTSLRLEQLVPSADKITDMTGMMTHPVSYSHLRRMSIREAENALFGDGCDLYFREHYVREARSRMEQMDITEELHASVRKHLESHSEIGFFQVNEWTDEKAGPGHVLEPLRAHLRDLAGQLDIARGELDRIYEGLVDDQTFKRLPMMDKHNVRQFVHYFFNTVYQHKLDVLALEMELGLHRRYEAELEHLHSFYKAQSGKLESLLKELHEAALASIRDADDYIGQNIMDYYGRVTEDVMLELEAKRGVNVFFEERYMGSISGLLDAGMEALKQRLIDVCRREVLTAEPFVQTFEEELMRRANVTIEFSNKQVLSKEELFKKLYRTLEEHAVINVRLFDYTQEHRYEEKYFFGDGESEFIRYALGADETSRIYRLGVVHEKRTSGVEKLNVMGGFHLEDLMYYRNGKVYYETYLQNGYEFHGVDTEQLPMLR